jgi:uncharacterized metal-binding protein
MPNKDTHDVGIAFAIGLSIATCVKFDVPLETAIPIVSGEFLGIQISPDLDLYENCRRGVWCWYWKMYGLLFRHRGISHWIIIGTLTRITYILITLFPLIFLLVKLELFGAALQKIPYNILLHIFYGLCISDGVHIVLDKISTGIKRKF